MTYQSTIKAMKYMVMFVVFMSINCMQKAHSCSSCGCPLGELACNCCPTGVSPNITADDILNYAKTGSHPDWEVIRKPETLKAPASAAEITVGEVKNLGNGSYTVHYTVRGIPQKATIVPKKAPQPAASTTK